MQNAVKVIAALIAVVVIGLGIGWWATHNVSPPPITVSTNQTASAAPAPQPIAPRTNPRVTPAPTPTNVAAPVMVAPATNPAPLPVHVGADWEEKLDEILSAEDDDTNKVARMLAMFPTLPPEAQEEVAQHLSNLTEDENYAPLGALLQDPKLPEDVLDVLLADLLNRPDGQKLPLLLAVAQTANHSKAEEAKDLLELYVDEDYGTDWDKWKQAVEKYLKDNVDTETPANP